MKKNQKKIGGKAWGAFLLETYLNYKYKNFLGIIISLFYGFIDNFMESIVLQKNEIFYLKITEFFY